MNNYYTLLILMAINSMIAYQNFARGKIGLCIVFICYAASLIGFILDARGI